MLEELRWQIDAIDTEIIKLLAKRFQVVEEIGLYKKENGLEAHQPARWLEVLGKRLELWRVHGISEDCIETIWNAIHEEALIKERKV